MRSNSPTAMVEESLAVSIRASCIPWMPVALGRWKDWEKPVSAASYFLLFWGMLVKWGGLPATWGPG
jgi:hypothetical protein